MRLEDALARRIKEDEEAETLNMILEYKEECNNDKKQNTR